MVQSAASAVMGVVADAAKNFTPKPSKKKSAQARQRNTKIKKARSRATKADRALAVGYSGMVHRGIALREQPPSVPSGCFFANILRGPSHALGAGFAQAGLTTLTETKRKIVG